MFKHNQYGMSILFIIYILILTSMVLIITSKVAPAYIENFFIVKTLKNLKNESAIQNADSETKQTEIRNKIMHYFQINDVKNIKSENY